MHEYPFMVNLANLAQWSTLVFGLVIGIPLTGIVIQAVVNALSKPPKT